MKHAASVSHEDATIQEFKDNPQDAAAYLSAVLVTDRRIGSTL